nr:glycine-rich RNA-binding protein 8-like [Lolium perenne]
METGGRTRPAEWRWAGGQTRAGGGRAAGLGLAKWRRADGRTWARRELAGSGCVEAAGSSRSGRGGGGEELRRRRNTWPKRPGRADGGGSRMKAGGGVRDRENGCRGGRRRGRGGGGCEERSYLQL